MRIILLGAPGSGKVTQAMKLSEYFGISWITTGQMLHDATEENSISGRQAKTYLDLGQHVPDEIVYAVLKERLARPDIHNGFLIVGFPRTAVQANALDEMLEALNLPLDLVLLLEGDPDHFMERLEGRCFCQTCNTMYNTFSNPPKVEGMCNLCGGQVRRRSEDNEETIAHRIRSYEQQVGALIEYYKLHGKLRQVSATGESEEVYDALCHIVDEQPPTVISTEPVVAAPVPLDQKPANDNEKKSRQGSSRKKASTEQKTTHEKKEAKAVKTAPKKVRVKDRPVNKKKAVTSKKAAVKKKVATEESTPVAANKAAGKKSTISGKQQTTKKKTIDKTAVKKAAAQARSKKAAVKKAVASKKRTGSAKKTATTKRGGKKGVTKKKR